MKPLKVIQATPVSTTHLVEYGITDTALAELREKNKGVIVNDTASLKAARANKSEIVSLRTSLEASRKEKKKDVLEYGRKLDAEASRIKLALEEIEALIKTPIDAYENKLAAEKAERERIELARIQKIKEAIELNFGTSALIGLSGADSDRLNQRLSDVNNICFDESFQEFHVAAEQQKARFILQLESLIADAEAKEREQKRLQREALRLERLREEQEERDRLVREALESEKAELARIKAEQAAAQQAIDDERASLDAEKKAAEARKAHEEFERQAKANAEQEAQEKLARQQREEEAAAEAKKIEAERQAALLPDKQKLMAFAQKIRDIELPELKAVAAKTIIAACRNHLMNTASLIENGATHL